MTELSDREVIERQIRAFCGDGEREKAATLLLETHGREIELEASKYSARPRVRRRARRRRATRRRLKLNRREYKALFRSADEALYVVHDRQSTIESR